MKTSHIWHTHDLCSTDLQWCFMLFKQLPSLTPDVVVCSRCAGFCDTTDSRLVYTVIHNALVYDLQAPLAWVTWEYNLQSHSKKEGTWAKQKHLICFSVVQLVHLLLALGERQHLSQNTPKKVSPAVPLSSLIPRQEQMMVMLLPALWFLAGVSIWEVWCVLLRRPGAGSVRMLNRGVSWDNWPSPLFHFATPKASSVPVGFCTPPQEQGLLAPQTVLTPFLGVGWIFHLSNPQPEFPQKLVEVINNSGQLHAEARY